MTAGAIAREQGYQIYALSFLYGQRHAIEFESAQRIATHLGVNRHEFLTIDLRVFGGSALTDDIDIPKPDDTGKIGKGIPVTYVPARNTIFLSFALAYAETVQSMDIFIGVNAIDYSGYPDCRPEYITAFERMANLGTKAGIEGRRFCIHAPLLHMNKTQIIREGVRLGLDFSLSHSCYAPNNEGKPCGACESCLLRKQGFDQAGLTDPCAE